MVIARLLPVLAVAIAGCRQPTRPPAASNADTDENQATLGKLQGYIDCLRSHSTRVFQIADLYRQRDDDKPGAANTDLRVEASPDPARCIEAIHDARTMRPSLPDLEAAAERFSRAVQQVFTLTTTAHGSSDAKTQRSAASSPASAPPATSVAPRAELLAAFEDFDAAQGALFDQVYQINRKVHLDQLTRREQREGRTLEIIIESAMFHAEDLVRFAATPWDHLDKLDLTAFTAVLSTLENTTEEMATFGIAHPKDADNFAHFDNFVVEVRTYLVAGKQLAQRARQHVAYTDAEKIMVAANNEASVVGSPAALARAYNHLLEESKRL